MDCDDLMSFFAMTKAINSDDNLTTKCLFKKKNCSGQTPTKDTLIILPPKEETPTARCLLPTTHASSHNDAFSLRTIFMQNDAARIY